MINTDGLGTFPAKPYDFTGEYGPASTDVHHRFSLSGSVNTKWNLRLSPFVVLESGPPFNIMAGRDLYGSTLFNTRPGIPTDLKKPGLIETSYGLLDPNPTADQKTLPRNYGLGPGAITVNLNLSKTFGFGPAREGAIAPSGGPGGPGGPGGSGRGYGRGGGGGFGFSESANNRRLELQLRLTF